MMNQQGQATTHSSTSQRLAIIGSYWRSSNTLKHHTCTALGAGTIVDITSRNGNAPECIFGAMDWDGENGEENQGDNGLLW